MRIEDAENPRYLVALVEELCSLIERYETLLNHHKFRGPLENSKEFLREQARIHVKLGKEISKHWRSK